MTALEGEAPSIVARRALDRYGLAGVVSIAPLGRGLINLTFRVDAPSGRFVLQRVNPIFDPAIHQNIHAVTECLAAAGLDTPRLRPTSTGELFVDLRAEGVWRLMTLVDGATFDVIEDLEQARSAGHLVGRFHAVLEDLDHEFVGLRHGVHDTPRHLATLREALIQHRGHRLYESVAPLGEAILAGAETLTSMPDLPRLVGHGDLKLNNLIFAGEAAAARTEALCLVDLDTVGPIHLGHELGDAWRSWCNPAGEDQVQAEFRLDVYSASLEGYRAGIGHNLSPAQGEALLGGPEWISLELSARLAADALRESYFGWDRVRYPGAGEHNLVRARGQWSLHQAILRTRGVRAALLGDAVTGGPGGGATTR